MYILRRIKAAWSDVQSESIDSAIDAGTAKHTGQLYEVLDAF